MAGRRLARVRIKSLAFATDVAIRSMEGATVSPRDGYLAVRTPDNPGFWWGNFLLLAEPPEPGSAGRWLERFAAEFPGARHIALGVDTADGDAVVPADFIEVGLEPERCVALTATELREPRHVNREVQIRPLGSGDDWQQTVDLEMRVFGSDEVSDSEYYRGRAESRRRIAEQGLGAWFGAFAGGRLVSQLGLFRAGDGIARYQHVETDPAARRGGLAGTLVWSAGQYGLEQLGAHTLVIVADPAEGPIRLYRSIGFADAEGQLSLCRPPAS
jgi:hypothetical protein